MPYLNQVTIMGHLTADPEIKYAPSGTAVLEFSLGLNSKSENASRSDFFDCTAFDGWAENLAKTLRKGSLVLVSGRLRQEQWVDSKTNGKRSRVKVVASSAFHVEAQYAEAQAEAAPEESTATF